MASRITIEEIREKSAFICDMDGVIYHGPNLLPGAKELLEWLQASQKQYLFLTNGSQKTARELSQKLERMGLIVSEEHFYTSALATAGFLKSQCPGGSAYVIGDAGLTNAIYEAGFTMNDYSPDYVVVGETHSYSFDKIEKASHLVRQGAKLIGTNPDVTGPTERGIVPACGALTAPIELSTGHKAYYVGKPNPLMMRHALRKLGAKREDTVIVGDRMDTDIIAGIESEIETVLVLSGVSDAESATHYPYNPSIMLNGVGDIPATS